MIDILTLNSADSSSYLNCCANKTSLDVHMINDSLQGREPKKGWVARWEFLKNITNHGLQTTTGLFLVLEVPGRVPGISLNKPH